VTTMNTIQFIDHVAAFYKECLPIALDMRIPAELDDVRMSFDMLCHGVDDNYLSVHRRIVEVVTELMTLMLEHDLNGHVKNMPRTTSTPPDPARDYLNDVVRRNMSILRAKNEDYSGDDYHPFLNFQSVELFTITSVPRGILVRCCDKLSRMGNLLTRDTGPAVADESVADTFMDMMNYLAILDAYLYSSGQEKKVNTGEPAATGRYNGPIPPLPGATFYKDN